MSRRASWHTDRGYYRDRTAYTRLTLMADGQLLWSWALPLIPEDAEDLRQVVESLRQDGWEVAFPALKPFDKDEEGEQD